MVKQELVAALMNGQTGVILGEPNGQIRNLEGTNVNFGVKN